MTAQLIDGKSLAAKVRAQLAERAARLTAAGHQPGLAVILVGEDPASQVYVRNKVRACAEVGILSVERRLPATTSQDELLALIRDLNADQRVDGILVQLPLPPQIDGDTVLEAIDPDKDADGFHPLNAGRLATGLPGVPPCTPAGVMRMITETGYQLRGKKALVVGRSNIVGKPLALLLLQANATVTIAHSHTADLAALGRDSDVLIAAVGRPGMIGPDMIKPGALVIDVGINRGPDGKLCGDVDPAARDVAGWLSPVPGGVGPMTIAMLLENAVRAAERRWATR